MEYLKQAAPRTAGEEEAVRERVADIIRNVRERGDQALAEYSARFDGSARTALRVSREEINAARAHREADQAREAMLQKKSRQEYQLAQASLARAMNRLRVKAREIS